MAGPKARSGEGHETKTFIPKNQNHCCFQNPSSKMEPKNTSIARKNICFELHKGDLLKGIWMLCVCVCVCGERKHKIKVKT